ncbi:hypothetical protein CI109_104263 [Kwoniella shandongensis]|uniref:Uncharacterized protein n=1 Tax=Kwoniella shandongensis TaxID=1734106 RepID=A0A5M6C0Z0_9TREE|nr:uncharacterized protein CI109_002831 [Kwoniella shandongensis]KAA5528673.1 hypothetical protein CI109_002831 [Kwoniella shandongensis]
MPVKSHTSRPLLPGIYGPLPTFFDDEQEIDFVSYKRHLLRLARLGIVPVCMGSLGEASHLTPEERISIIRFIRATLDEEGMESRPIVAGVGGASTRESIRLARDASEAGADAGMVILPAYYAASLNADPEQVIQYYVDICAASPIPILLYNFPANSAGQDMSSDIIEEIMRRAPNLCGVKLTCPGSMSKLLRLKSALATDPTLTSSRSHSFPFLLLDGLISDLIPWMSAGGHGTVSGIPNFAPSAGVRLLNLCQKPNKSVEEIEEMKMIQDVLSRADVLAVPGGVRAMKYVLHRLHGYSLAPRRPLLPLSAEEGEKVMMTFKPMLDLEASLEKKMLKSL